MAIFPFTDVATSPDLSERLREYEADLPSSVDFGLQHVSYNNSGLVDVVFGHLNRTNFSGITVCECVCVCARVSRLLLRYVTVVWRFWTLSK